MSFSVSLKGKSKAELRGALLKFHADFPQSFPTEALGPALVAIDFAGEPPPDSEHPDVTYSHFIHLQAYGHMKCSEHPGDVTSGSFLVSFPYETTRHTPVEIKEL